MSFESQMQDMDDLIMSEFDTVTISYTPSGGSAKSILAILTDLSKNENDNPERSTNKYITTGNFFIRRDATTGIASPSLADKISYNGSTWSIVEIMNQDVSGTTLRAVTEEINEQGVKRMEFGG